MKKLNPELNNHEVSLKLITKEDINPYFATAFENIDSEVQYFTGTTQTFTKEQISEYVNRIVEDESRYDFLIRNNKNQLLGEIVLNEIDWEERIAGFRIALFSKVHCNAGIGKKSISILLQFAFETLQLHRVELEVFDFNERAKHVYEMCGFQVEGKKRDALFINNTYHDIYIMGILEDDYFTNKK